MIEGRVLDAQGKAWGDFQMENTDRLLLDMKLPEGLYWIKLEMDGMRKVVKFVRANE